MSKEHWSTVVLDGTIPDAEILARIDESYGLVVAWLTRARRDRPPRDRV